MATNDFYIYVVDRKTWILAWNIHMEKVVNILPSNNQLVLFVPSSFIFNVCVYSSNRPKNRSTITRMTDDKVYTFREGNYRLVKPKVAIKS